VVALNPAGMDIRSYEPALLNRLEQAVGVAAGKLIEYSVLEYVRPGNPPVLIQHGTEDEVEPIANVRRFRDAMTRSDNVCTVLEYDDAKHAFHFPDGGHFDDVVEATVRFLREHVAAPASES
jgi:acetyl esterase/lipase